MSNAMHVAKTGLNAQNTRMQVIANNLANVNTTGFKKDRANFESLLYQVIKESGAQTSGETKTNSAFSVGTGVRIINSDKLFSQGNIVSTDNALDISIDGSGFFQVLMPDGRIGFTRNGAFGRNAEGLLTTASGYVIQPEVAIPEGVTSINISADGIVTVQNPGEVEAEEISQAFSTGAVESMITSPTTGKNSKIWENGVKYFYDIAAWYPKNMIIVNKDAWSKLDSATQKLVMSEAAVAEKKGWDLSKKGNTADKKALADAGMTVGKVNSALNNHFKEVGSTMSKEWASRAGSRGQSVLAAYK